ncbi:ABC transporter ATP-binding protein [Candidatus Mycoplasma haematominutum]|uniref:Polyamine (Spermidine/putrescine) ABC transporter ATP-binding protein n=1 Tax=Candidatus Mycoplasma haematominutum 'Birmingham 1' TaxID=1116213 RepID=G8C2L4_9MOLU|nr:ABC transporter ATP-binding protein [Candidatus Mycoplasma haematominutum]CCE66562.1 polyamine (spermidine/putrescine) ABC transporter ATP-binding protein [Candidatus Mycoplasma haematominutum 'Birmingham 1']
MKETTPLLQLQSISKRYEAKENLVLDNFNLTIEKGSFVTIIGPSGSGKTTILNLIGGFIKPDKGKILLSGIDIKDIPADLRPTSTVFQDYALFPHLTVFENISFGLKKKRVLLSNPPNYKVEKMQQLIDKAKFKSQEKLKKLQKETDKFAMLFKKWAHYVVDDTRHKNFKRKLIFFYLSMIKSKLLDLDYWKSWWEYYPILKEKELRYKYISRPFTSEEIEAKVAEISTLLGLESYKNSSIETLSGGTKQKVALARALITEPQIILLDEPLSAIDKDMREKMQIELKKLHQTLKLTFLLITHDQKEALLLSDQVVVLKRGKIEQIGSPSEVYDSPVNEWVANFMGKSNIFDGIYLSPWQVYVNDMVFKLDNIRGFQPNERVQVMIRPEDYDVTQLGTGFISVEVIDAIYKGQLWELKCLFGASDISVESFNEVKKGTHIDLLWDSEDVHLMKFPGN